MENSQQLVSQPDRIVQEQITTAERIHSQSRWMEINATPGPRLSSDPFLRAMASTDYTHSIACSSLPPSLPLKNKLQSKTREAQSIDCFLLLCLQCAARTVSSFQRHEFMRDGYDVRQFM